MKKNEDSCPLNMHILTRAFPAQIHKVKRYLGVFMLFCHLLIFSQSTFFENSFKNTIRESNRSDPDQAQ